MLAIENGRSGGSIDLAVCIQGTAERWVIRPGGYVYNSGGALDLAV
ncbi:MAG: hypothetical protein GY820_18800 [Gammaproteobacteria bacterium]|nr:hypothetical protein [Gammaproteobacteria bacterium]